MANLYGPILPLQLDSRNTQALVRAIQTRINLESEGQLNDFTPASPLAAISEGQALAQAELLYYLNNLPEAFSLQWLRQLGVQRRIGARALVDVTFYKIATYNKVVLIPKGTKVYSNNGLVFQLLSDVRILESEFSATGLCMSEKWGSVYNVGSGTINKIEKNFLGLESLSNQNPASGGKDVESVDEMKVRAFEVLSRRNLTTSLDFENEVRMLAPDSSIVKVLTYEERTKVNSFFSGNVVICVGDENGRALSSSTQKLLIDSMKDRVTIGTNLSIVTPEVVPVDVVLDINYDPSTTTTNLSVLSSDLLQFLKDYINPNSLGLGNNLEYESVSREVYQFDFVRSINNLDLKLMIKDSGVLEGFCAGFSGIEDETNGSCFYDYSEIINNDNKLKSPNSGIESYKLYRASITFTSIRDSSPLTFLYDSLYTP